MRLKTIYAAIFPLACVSCGSSSNSPPSTNQPAAGVVDVPMAWPEGGEVRMDRVVYTDGSYPGEVYGISFFKKHQTPDRFPILGEDMAGCFDSAAIQAWPTAQASDRQYVDVGTLTLSDDSTTLEMPKQMNQSDELLRMHDISYGYDGFSADTYAQPGHTYSINLSGSSQYDAVTWPNVLKVPLDFAMKTPARDATLANLDATKDYVIEADVPQDPEVRLFSTFFQPTGGISIICFDTLPGTGRLTIPAALLAKAPSSGLLVRGHLLHRTVEFNDGHGTRGRRIDVVSVNCFATPYMISGGAATPDAG